MNRSFLTLPALLLGGCLFLANCNGSDNGENGSSAPQVSEHPMEEDIPYFDREHTAISRGSSMPAPDDSDGIPGKLRDLQRYLQDPDRFGHKELDIRADAAYQTDIVSFGQDQLVILGRGSDSLIQYDLETDRTVTLASYGRGPGDIAYPMELIRDGGTVYVAMEDMRLSAFDCSSVPCDYEETVNLDFSPVSAAVNGRKMAFLAYTPYLGEEMTVDDHAIRLLDPDTGTEEAFGSFYETDEFMVRFSFRGGSLNYSPRENQYILAFERLPLIYLFDENRELADSYRITEFIQSSVFFNRSTGAVSHPGGNSTMINDITLVDDQFALIITTTQSEEGFEESGGNNLVRQDYYVVDLSARQGYHIGTDNSGPGRLLYITDDGMLILNQSGTLYLIQEEAG